jgi:hypothetical protein
MTVDEGLAIVETVLNLAGDEDLNDVQELIFRECWQGHSYRKIAELYPYEYEYIKAYAAELWRKLSKAFEKKVKKGNLKSVIGGYLRKNRFNLQRNLVVEVNLGGADIGDVNLSGARLFANLNEADFVQSDSVKARTEEDRTNPNEQTPGIDSAPEEQIYRWNDWEFTSESQVRIAEALDRVEAIFFPNTRGRFTTLKGRQNQEYSFLVCHEGKWGILAIEPDASGGGVGNNERINPIFRAGGICAVEYYQHRQCCERPDKIVEEFLNILASNSVES